MWSPCTLPRRAVVSRRPCSPSRPRTSPRPRRTTPSPTSRSLKWRPLRRLRTSRSPPRRPRPKFPAAPSPLRPHPVCTHAGLRRAFLCSKARAPTSWARAMRLPRPRVSRPARAARPLRPFRALLPRAVRPRRQAPRRLLAPRLTPRFEVHVSHACHRFPPLPPLPHHPCLSLHRSRRGACPPGPPAFCGIFPFTATA